ncbi:MAG: alpha/beta hydrolase [Candidatus Omnitrophota bacterium]
MKSRLVKRAILFISIVVLLPCHIAFGKILDQWSDSDAYKPNPILFLHGFALGKPDSWNRIVDDLKKYFNDYTPQTTNLDLSLPYLERLAFNDPNGSIDTYSPEKLNPDGNSDGWADKINNRINKLLPIYKFKGSSLKFILICHSMGGLAAREYITNPKYTNSKNDTDKLITIGTPHAGSPLANIKKIEDAATGMYKYIWDIPVNEKVGIQINYLELTDKILQFLRGEYHINPEGEDLKDMAVKSPFLTALNARIRPSGFKSYAIYGELKLLLNGLFSAYYPSEPWTCGDSIVPRDSQIGIDIMTNYPDTTPRTIWNFAAIEKIPADHFTELEFKDTVQKILSFLDSTQPEFEITSPDPTKVTEIFENSVHIQGKACKEYLPADTKLNLTITRQSDGYTMPVQSSLLKPSDLWIPNNPDSPVAEFDEIVNFPGTGTYKISCQIENPAGIHSETKEILVKVNVIPGTNIIVHCHNPEGKEINSITGVGNQVTIYDGNISIGYGAFDGKTHGKAIAISAGQHTIKAKFNGMTKEQTATLNSNETKGFTFTFERSEVTADVLFNFNGSCSGAGEFDEAWVGGSASESDLDSYINYNSEISGNTVIRFHEYWLTHPQYSWNYDLNFTLATTGFSGNFHCSLSNPNNQEIWLKYCWTNIYINKNITQLFQNNFLFDNWYAQSFSYNSFNFWLTSTFGEKFYLPNQYSCLSIIPNLHFITLNSEVILGSKPWEGWFRLPYEFSYNIEKKINYSNLKFSSAPYDLDGKAI